MEIQDVTGIPGAIVFQPNVHADERGSFLEIFRENLLGVQLVQANHSLSRAGVLRGLHYHHRQADAWYVIRGEAQAMLADLRVPGNPPTVVSIDLTATHPRVLYIPPGIAHGFLAISDLDLIYWVTHYYDSSDEFGIAWDDPTLAAPWRISNPILSERDKNNPKLEWNAINLS